MSRLGRSQPVTPIVLVGAFVASGGTQQIAGATINATSAMSGAVTKTALVKPAAINSTSNVTATVAKTAKIAGTINATSAASGSLVAVRAIRLASINSTSTVSGAVVVLRAVRQATINATSTVTASLGKVGTDAIVPVAINSTSTVSGVVTDIVGVKPFLLYIHTGTDRLWNIERWLIDNDSFQVANFHGLDRITSIEEHLAAHPVNSLAFVPFGRTGTERLWGIEEYLIAASS